MDADYEKIVDSFIQFEDQYNMFQVKVSGLKVWHYIREIVFMDLADQLGFSHTKLTVRTTQMITVDHTLKDFFREKVICNQFFAHKRDVLIFPNVDKYQDNDGYYRCIYTNLLDEAMKRSHYLLDIKSERGVYEKQRSQNVLYLNLDAFKKINKIKRNGKSINKLQVEKNIILPIENHYNIKVNLENRKNWLRCINYILEVRADYICYYNYMLRKVKPKAIIVTSAGDLDKMLLCETAKKKSIPVIELQHGLIGRTHIAYNFLKKMNLPAFPDYIFTFGRFDKVTGRFPIADSRIIPTGFPELENSYNKYCKSNKKIEKKRKQILFISQHLVEIAQYADMVANILDSKEYRIIFKLHPSEYGTWRKKYGGYLNNPNIEVAGDTSRTIHSFLAQADWVVGYYSTVLYEATMFDVKIAIINAALSDYVKDLYNNGFAILVDSPQRLAEEIIGDTFETNSKENLSIFEKNSVHNMLKWIDKIIEENSNRK